MTEPIRDDRTPDKDEQRQALPGWIWAALDAERNRGERHVDEIGTDHLVDAVMLPVDEYADGLYDDLEDDNERLRGDLARADAACIEARAHRGEAVAENDRLRAELAKADAELAALRAAQPGTVAELRALAKDLNQRGNQRDTIGSDDSDGCPCDEEGDDCHTAAAVATWWRASRILERRADELDAAPVWVPAEAGDSTADETSAQVEFDVGGKTYVGKAMPRREGENAPSWTTVDTGGPLGVFLVPNCDLRPASSVRDTAETTGGAA
jgi:hypothetical protein